MRPIANQQAEHVSREYRFSPIGALVASVVSARIQKGGDPVDRHLPPRHCAYACRLLSRMGLEGVATTQTHSTGHMTIIGLVQDCLVSMRSSRRLYRAEPLPRLGLLTPYSCVWHFVTWRDSRSDGDSKWIERWKGEWGGG